MPLYATGKNNSYLVESDSQTEMIYGIDAAKFLENNQNFPYDTQIIFPKGSQGILHIKGKDIEIKENFSILLNAGAEADVEILDGFPMVVISKKDFDWYERYKRDAQDINIKNKFSELMYFNSHLYNGEFTTDALLPGNLLDADFLRSIYIDKWESRNSLVYELYNKRIFLAPEDQKQVEFVKNIVDKLYEKGLVEPRENGYSRFKFLYEEEFNKKLLSNLGFTKEEITVIAPVYHQARQVRLDSKPCIKNSAEFYDPELVKRMKEKEIFINNKEGTENVYWKKLYGNTETLRNRLAEGGFNWDEQNEILTSWYEANKTGFDISGLKFFNDDIAVYNLNDKLNNWTQEKTNWLTNSTAPANSQYRTPFIGVSMVWKEGESVVKMSDVRKEEKLHSHPNLDEKSQTEIYLVTSGAAALNVVKDGKGQIKVLEEGDLAVISPGVAHCINSIKGNYEHICTQVPSAFQYSFGFKQIVEPPSDYSEEKMTAKALRALLFPN